MFTVDIKQQHNNNNNEFMNGQTAIPQMTLAAVLEIWKLFTKKDPGPHSPGFTRYGFVPISRYKKA